MVRPKWHLVVYGISHKTSELQDREPLQVGRYEIAEANHLLGNLPGVMESLIVSTCNRVEFYLVVEKSDDICNVVRDFYKQWKSIDISGLEPKFYVKKGRHAAGHLFHVAAGIDSMIIGENQIMGQLKDAYSSSCSVKSSGKLLHRLFHQAFRVGKAVRTDTEMGKGACSVSGAAVSLLKERIADVKSPSVLFVGVNQMISLAASNLSKLNYGRFHFANRTPEKAEAMAAKYRAVGHSLDDIPGLVNEVDVIVSCTGSNEPVIRRDMIQSALPARNGRKLVVIDIAIPRDVEYDDSESDKVDVFDLENLKEFVRNRQQQVEKAIPQAEIIIDKKLDEFVYWYNHLLHEPLYNGLDKSFEDMRLEELGPILDSLSPESRDALESASRRLINRLLKLKVRTESDSAN